MKRLYKLIERLYDKKIDASGLAVFRIAYAIVLLCEVCQIYYFRHLIYDKIPYVQPADFDVSYGLIVWMITLVMLALGWYTRMATIVNYILGLVFVATLQTYEYHMFYAYMGINFLLIWMNSSQVASIDRLREIWKYSTAKNTYKPTRKVSVLNYYIVIFVAVAIVYSDSILYKFTSHNWMTGMGMWLPASLPHMTHIDATPFLNLKWLALGLGYLTVVFEFIFIFTFFRKRWRIPLLIIGVGLHIGILVEFPIPWFGLGVTGIYMLMVPVSFWKKLHARFRFNNARLTFFYDGECPLCARAVIFLGHFDFFNILAFKTVQSGASAEVALSKISKEELLQNIHGVSRSKKVVRGIDVYRFAFLRMPLLFPLGVLLLVPGIYHIGKAIYKFVALNRHVERCTDDNCGYSPPLFPTNDDDIKLTHSLSLKSVRVGAIFFGLSAFMILQLNTSYNSELTQVLKRKLGFHKSPIEHKIQELTEPIREKSLVLFGIVNHPVFMDGHFRGYNHLFTVEAELQDGSRIWLPILDQEGHVGNYLYSFAFVKWTFRVDGGRVKMENLENGIRDFSTFWAVKHDIPLDKVKFHVLMKEIEIPYEWEENFLRKQEANPWNEIGVGFWQGKNFVIDLPEIEVQK